INAAPTACKRTVSGTISPSCSEYFSPFPYGTGSLSVIEEYLALPDGAGRFTQDFSGPALLRILHENDSLQLRGFHPLWLLFPEKFVLKSLPKSSPTTPWQHATKVWAIPASLATTRGIISYFLFLQVLRCFSSLGWLHCW